MQVLGGVILVFEGIRIILYLWRVVPYFFPFENGTSCGNEFRKLPYTFSTVHTDGTISKLTILLWTK